MGDVAEGSSVGPFQDESEVAPLTWDAPTGSRHSDSRSCRRTRSVDVTDQQDGRDHGKAPVALHGPERRTSA